MYSLLDPVSLIVSCAGSWYPSSPCYLRVTCTLLSHGGVRGWEGGSRPEGEGHADKKVECQSWTLRKDAIRMFSSLWPGLALTSCRRDFLDADSSDSELSFLMFDAHAPTRPLQERRRTQLITTRKSSNRGGKPSSSSCQVSPSQEEHVGRSKRALRPKPPFHTVDEECESGEESGEEVAAPGARQSAEHRRAHSRSCSPLLRRK